MNRKFIFFLPVIALTMLCTLPVHAQRHDGNRSYDQHGREKIRAAQAAYITQRLSLTPEEAQAFWPVYNEYSEKRRGIRREWLETRKNETDEKKLLDHDIKVKQQELDLEKEYTDRFQKIIPAEKVVKLRAAEMDFRKLILRQMQKRRRN